MKKITTIFSNSKDQDHYQKWLLLALLLFLIIPVPITFFPESDRLIIASIFTILVISGVISASEKRRQRMIGWILGILSFMLIWGHYLSGSNEGLHWGKVLSLLAFFSYLALLLFRKLALSRTINLNVIFASISGYLIIGITGGLIFQLLELTFAGSFNGISSNNNLFDLHYFSFVTLTTLGFGDISPGTEAAKSLTIILSIAGQLYLTILIAILVGKYLSKPNL